MKETESKIHLATIVDLPELSKTQIEVLVTLGNIVSETQNEVAGGTDQSQAAKLYIDPNVILDYLTEVTNRGEQQDEQVEQNLESIPEKVINKALVQIDWVDNTPVVNGLPVWERLDCEPLDYYRIYKIYRDQKIQGIERQKPQTPDPEGDTQAVSRVRHQRSFDNLSRGTKIPVKALYALNKVYHWQLRIKMYDIFREDLLEKERNHLIELMETNHRNMAKKMFDKSMSYLDTLGDKQLKKFSPPQVMKMLELALKMDRLSLGIPADKPLTKDDQKKLTNTLTVQRDESKHLTLNINQGKTGKEKDKYLQEMVDILNVAGALPKPIEAKADMVEELDQKEVKETENEKKPS